jgi:ribonuclease-3
MDLHELERRIGYRFVRPELLRTAVAHRSSGTPNNERLEFLGDGLLDFLVAELLYQRFADSSEGDLTRLRAQLVRQETLHELADELDLGRYLALGEGERKSGGRRRPSILADACEALMAAIYLDGGFSAARDLAGRLFGERIAGLDPRFDGKDAKTRLQEFLQAERRKVPSYRIVATDGDAHAQRFTVVCELVDPPLVTTGHGSSRRAAEQQAAALALKELEAAR